MKKLLFATAVSLLPLFTVNPQNVQNAKHALVIGNGSYTALGRLNNPVNDASDVKAVLESLGFQVDLILNGTLPQMEDGVIRLKRRLNRDSRSYGFFFYAGHGVQSQGENYLIPADADIKSESFLKGKALAVQSVLDEMRDAGNELNLVVLDACRDNPFSWARSGSRGLTVTGRQPPGSIVVYATSVGETASDGTGRNGLFTGRLLGHLKTPGLEVKEIFNRTGADVQRASNNGQIPAIYSQFFSTAYLNVAPVQTSAPAQPASTPDTAPAQPPRPAAPFTDGRWEGSISYRDADGKNHTDRYEIVFVKTGVCFITLRTKEDGADLFQDGDGLWSFTEGDFPVLRIECVFPDPVLQRLSSINWTSLYQFDANQTRFTLLVPPYPGAERNARLAFVQTKDE